MTLRSFTSLAAGALAVLVAAPALTDAPAEGDARGKAQSEERETPEAAAGERPPSPKRGEEAGPVSAPPPPAIYRPPSRGKPRARVAGGVRGVDRIWPSVFALVPAHIGLTVAESPPLYWYLDAEPSDEVSFVFTIIDEASVDPLVETELPRPAGPGIQRVDLAALGVELERGVDYQWSVALVVDPRQRARDLVAAGWIERVEAPGDLPEDPDATAYAQRGLWYDALAAAQARVRAQGSAEALRVRDALLLQVDLGAATAEGG